jgi:hypothetical protein
MLTRGTCTHQSWFSSLMSQQGRGKLRRQLATLVGIRTAYFDGMSFSFVDSAWVASIPLPPTEALRFKADRWLPYRLSGRHSKPLQNTGSI